MVRPDEDVVNRGHFDETKLSERAMLRALKRHDPIEREKDETMAEHSVTWLRSCFPDLALRWEWLEEGAPPSPPT